MRRATNRFLQVINTLPTPLDTYIINTDRLIITSIANTSNYNNASMATKHIQGCICDLFLLNFKVANPKRLKHESIESMWNEPFAKEHLAPGHVCVYIALGRARDHINFNLNCPWYGAFGRVPRAPRIPQSWPSGAKCSVRTEKINEP